MLITKDTVVVITGSNRGLGLELTTQLLNNTDAMVVATARDPDKAEPLQLLHSKKPQRLQLVALDASDERSVQAAARDVSSMNAQGIDLLINNAGVSEGPDSVLELDAATYSKILTTNVVGPYLITQALLPLLKKKQTRTVVNMSSTMGSTSWNRMAFEHPDKNPVGAKFLAYNSSKAALNMQTSVFANELKGDNFCIIALSPGWVNTDMGGGNARKMGMERAPLDAHVSIAKVLKVIEQLSPKNSGQFLDENFSTPEY